jgi:hypothetical protein
MDGDPSLADAATLTEVIAKPAMRTEQFQALRLAEPERALLRPDLPVRLARMMVRRTLDPGLR